MTKEVIFCTKFWIRRVVKLGVKKVKWLKIWDGGSSYYFSRVCLLPWLNKMVTVSSYMESIIVAICMHFCYMQFTSIYSTVPIRTYLLQFTFMYSTVPIRTAFHDIENCFVMMFLLWRQWVAICTVFWLLAM